MISVFNGDYRQFARGPNAEVALPYSITGD
jgi:hypothetical protein